MALNVMVVDHSGIIRKMIIKTLNLCGLKMGEVHEAANGAEGLETLENHWIDLVFADLNMPVMDGEEMIDRMRANPMLEDVALIVVSTEGSETRIARLKEKGAEFIHKPFPPEEVRRTVMRMLGLTNEHAA